MTRASMLAVLASDFVRTARASGLSSYTVIVTYAFRNAMLPVVTTLGMVFSFLLGANVLVEKVFAWPGIGSLRGRGADRVGLRAGAGLRAHHGDHVRRAQPPDRHALRPDRSAREAGSMTDVAVAPPPSSGLVAMLRHARYVIGENPVTGFAFGLFVADRARRASSARYIVPYDPLASNTAHGAASRRRRRTGSAPTSSAATSSAA